MSALSEGPIDPVRPYFRERLRHLYKNFPLAMAGQEEPVHQVRVASRRLRVLVPIVARKPQGRKVRRTLGRLRDLARAAGRARDMDVIAALFDQHAAAFGQRSGAGLALRRRLADARRRAHARTTEDLLDFEVPRLRRDLARISGRGLADLFTAAARLHEIRATEGRDLLQELESLGTRFEPVALHELRARVRRLRYAAEISSALVDSPAETARRFKQTQEILGEVHDAWILAEWLGAQASAAAARERVAEADEAAHRRAYFEDLARVLHGKFLESNPSDRLRRALAGIGRRASVA